MFAALFDLELPSEPMSRVLETYLATIESPHQEWINALVCPTSRLVELDQALEAAGIESGFPVMALESSETIGDPAHLRHKRMELEGYVVGLSSSAVDRLDKLRASPLYRELGNCFFVAADEAHEESNFLYEVNATLEYGGFATSPGMHQGAGQLAHWILEATSLEAPVWFCAESAGLCGFAEVSLMLAVLFAESLELSRKEIQAIIEETDPKSFQWTTSGITYQGLRLDWDEPCPPASLKGIAFRDFDRLTPSILKFLGD